MWVVWEITARDFKEIFRTPHKYMAEKYAENMNKLHSSIRYEVTKAGDTPVW